MRDRRRRACRRARSIVAAVAAYLTLRRACATARPLDDEIRRGKAAFDGVIAAEVERRAAEREFRRYLGCGILAHGFARAICDACQHDFLIAFSCKGRGVCPSCNRRMVETAAHLTEHVMPRLPARQWVLSVPKRLRYFLQNDAAVQTLALHLFLAAVEQGVRRCSPGRGPAACIGAVAFISFTVSAPCSIPTCTSTASWSTAFFQPDGAGGAHFHEARGVGPATIAEIQTQARHRLLSVLARRGMLARTPRRWAVGITAEVSRWMPACG